MHVMHKKHVQLGIKEGRVFSEGPENQLPRATILDQD